MARAFRHCSATRWWGEKKKAQKKIWESWRGTSKRISDFFFNFSTILTQFGSCFLWRGIKIMSQGKLSYVLQKAESWMKSDFRATAVMNAKSENELPSFLTQSQSTWLSSARSQLTLESVRAKFSATRRRQITRNDFDICRKKRERKCMQQTRTDNSICTCAKKKMKFNSKWLEQRQQVSVST